MFTAWYRNGIQDTYWVLTLHQAFDYSMTSNWMKMKQNTFTSCMTYNSDVNRHIELHTLQGTGHFLEYSDLYQTIYDMVPIFW